MVNLGRSSFCGWKAKRRADVGTFALLLEDAGTDVRWIKDGEEVGQGEAIRFELPSGHRFEIYYDMEKPAAEEGRKSVLKNQVYKSWAKGVSPRRIDHVNLQTSMDNKRIVNYLTETLGFKLREYFVNPDDEQVASWMSVTNLVHDVAMMTTKNSIGPNEMHHIAYWLDNSQDLLRAADILCENEVGFVGPGKHGISQAMYIYVKDPGSGLRVEIFTNSYLIFEPDWEPIKWCYDEYLKHGSTIWCDRRRDDVNREQPVKA
ncbi:2,3-dihydroxybiphenyl 1,2-dioxygenase [Bacillus sp. AFS073361]|uniref:VOC family protein n=1 Tax=Bacillus sp. AFS073361 TaxID=2033511 RepID=UPI000BF2B50C|nr:VOC family protein [Bacillus sp. AFS073361]PFP30538.1 2,3-dihydroxybiphenyl 1,2-dioxygenase [Bacillus sp. AFS073361]